MQRGLIIDSSAIVRKVSGVILRDFGFEVHDAATGREGLALYNRYLPEVVLLDARLPDMHAHDVLRNIRQAGNGAAFVLYCTTDYDLVDLQQAHAAGAADVLVKPFDRTSLAGKLDGRTGDPRSLRPNFYARLSRSELKRLA